MATVIDTTIPAGAGTPASLLSRTFRIFAASLPALIADERDLAGYSGQDPALDAWFRAAERSRGATLSCLNAVISANPMCRSDRAMHLVAVVFRAVLVSSNADQVERLTVLACRMFARADLSRDVGRTINAVLDALSTYVAIETFGDAVEAAVARGDMVRFQTADGAGPFCEDLPAATPLPAAA